MSVQMRLVLGALCIWNAFVLLVLGMMSLVFVAGFVRVVLGVGLWLVAGGLVALARTLRKPVEWR